MKKNQSGQALVLVLLSLAVVLTIVLFIISRSIIDVSISSRQEDAVRAFSAAEAGIEQALIIGSGTFSSQVGDANFTSTVTDFAVGESSFVYPLTLASGDSITLWLVAHDADGTTTCSIEKPCFTGNTLKVCWGRSGTGAGGSTTPAVELSTFYNATPGSPATARIGRVALDPNSGRRPLNSFEAPDGGTCTIGGEVFQFQKTITFSSLGVPATSYNAQNGLQFVRVRMLYNTDINHGVAFSTDFSGNSTLPSQGIVADSSGTAGDANRRLEVFQGWPEPPSVLDYAIYSSTGIVK
jgi:hypothetical protein